MPDVDWRVAQEYFDGQVDFWDDVYEGSDVYSRIHQRRHSTASAWVRDLKDPIRLTLELGPGTGRFTAELAMISQVIAVDTSIKMLRRARSRVASQEALLLCANAERIPLVDSSIDLVVALGVLPWLTRPSDALSEVARVMKPGGLAVINIDNRWRLATLLDPIRTPLTGPLRAFIRRRMPSKTRNARVTMHTAGKFDGELERAGLVIRKQRWIGFGPLTIFRRPVLRGQPSVWIDDKLQSRSDSGSRLRRLASQYIVLCAKVPLEDGS